MMQSKFNSIEKSVVTALSAIFALRMLGLFMIVPIFPIEANKFSGATQQLIGVAISGYGLTQALLQLPFGMLSDRLGRKKIVLFGLLLLIAGSLIAMITTSIYGLIIGRAMQGTGAVGCVLMAALADNTRESVRVRSMGIMGASIGMSFLLALVIGPVISNFFGLQGVFAFTAILGAMGIWLLTKVPENIESSKEKISIKFIKVIFNYELLKINLAIFWLHCSLSAMFLVVPLFIQEAGFLNENLWALYLGVLVLAMIFNVVLIKRLDFSNNSKKLLISTAFLMIFAKTLIYFAKSHLTILVIGLVLYFIAFCALEVSLPAIVSKYTDKSSKGTAMGVFTSLQFLGIFFGGMMGGVLHGNLGSIYVYIFSVALILSWLLLLLKPQEPQVVYSK